MAGGDLVPRRSGPARSGSAPADGRTAAPVPSVEGYLAALDGRLNGPRRVRAAVLAELEDGLLEAVEARTAAGLAEPAARAAALAEFGEPATVAAAFQPGLAARQARATVMGLLRSGPLLGLCWGATLLASGVTPWHRPHAGPLALALPLVGLLVVTVWLAALATFAATGRLGLRLARTPSSPPWRRSPPPSPPPPAWSASPPRHWRRAAASPRSPPSAERPPPLPATPAVNWARLARRPRHGTARVPTGGPVGGLPAGVGTTAPRAVRWRPVRSVRATPPTVKAPRDPVAVSGSPEGDHPP